MKKENNIFVQFLMTLFAIYAVLIVLVSFLIVVPIYLFIFSFLPKDKAPLQAHKMSRFWSKFLFAGFFIKADIKGREFIEPDKQYVFVCNHRSQLDIPTFAIACKNIFRFLSKVEATKIPAFGYVVKKLYITVDRKSKRGSVESFIKMKDSLLKEKISIAIFPEGTRNRTSEPLGIFKDGAFRLAIETKVPVAVLTILNSGDFSPANKFMQLRPGTLKAVWTEPIPTDNMTIDDVPRLKEQVKQRMLSVLAAN